MPGKESPRIVTGGVIYIRFHGTTGRYSGSYPKFQLQNWIEWLEKQGKHVHAIYIYFNNDSQGHVINNAKQLKSLLNSRLPVRR